MAFSPDTGFAYIPIQDYAATFQTDPDYVPTPNARASGMPPAGGVPQDRTLRAGFAKALDAKLVAWDVAAQRPAWTFPYGYAGNGGVLATKGGLVFQSGADGVFRSMNAATGKLLWQFDAQATAQGGPITYSIGGTQYVAIAIGNGGAHWLAGGLSSPQRKPLPTGRVLVFRLGANAAYPRIDTAPEPTTAPVRVTVDRGILEKGARKYAEFCAACHGFGAISGQVTPDLRRSMITGDKAAFRQVVKDGALLQNGMPAFGSELGEQDVEAIRAFVIDEAIFLAGGQAQP